MQLTRSEVVDLLTAARIYRPWWFIADAIFNTLDREQVIKEFHPAWVRSLPAELVEFRNVKPDRRILLPKWLPNVLDCENHAMDFQAYVIRCCAVEAVKSGKPRGGTLLGSMDFTADGTNDHRRTGRHDISVFIDHDKNVNWLETADGEIIVPMTEEILSVQQGDLR